MQPEVEETCGRLGNERVTMSVRRKLPEETRRHLTVLADNRCSCFRSPEIVGIPMLIDHIVPLSAGGGSEVENLCLACYRCNEFKGAKREDPDPLTDMCVGLFKPRMQAWTEHFAWSRDGLRVVGLSACGRATVETLRMNEPHLIKARRIWMLVGLHPPLASP